MSERGTPLRPTRAEIDLDAIAHNVAALRTRIAPAQLCAVVKADGYGHGAVPVARAALDAGATWLAVALVEEGEELRDAGITAPILVMAEPPARAAARVIAAELTPSVYSAAFADALRAAAGDRRLRVHVKADTGMARVGVPPAQWDAFLDHLRASQQLEVEALWTHLANADQPGHETIDEQVARFEEFVGRARSHGIAWRMTHLANSAGGLAAPHLRGDMVRAGIAMYGLASSKALAATEVVAQLRPALRLVTEVALVKPVNAGLPASYGHTWRAPTDGWLATLPIGYADGVPRNLSNRGSVLVGGRRRPIAGTVTMDQLLVWCGDDEVRPGDEAVLLGAQGSEDINALEWAETLGTITYEVVCGIGPRVPRVYVHGGR